jgi:hypothetical protein
VRLQSRHELRRGRSLGRLHRALLRVHVTDAGITR